MQAELQTTRQLMCCILYTTKHIAYTSSGGSQSLQITQMAYHILENFLQRGSNNEKVKTI